MVRTVNELNLDVLNRITSQNAGVECFLNTLVDSGDVLLGNYAANDLVLERVAFAGLLRVHVDDGMTILTTTTGLTDELALSAEYLMTRTLTVSNLGLTNVSLNLELTKQAVDDDLQVEFAHASDDGLAGFMVGGNAERRVFLGELLQSDAHLILLSLGLRLNSNVDNRISELHGLEDDRSIFGAERVTGGGVLQTNNGNDVASGANVDVNTVVGVHLQKTADAFLLVLGSVQHVGAGLESAGVYAQVGELANERVGHDLECQGSKRCLRVGRTLVFFAGFGVRALDGGNVYRRRHVVNNSVEQFLNALVLVSGAYEHGVELALANALADSSLEFLNGNFLFHEDLFHQIVVAVCSCFEKFLMIELCIFLELSGDLVHGLRVGHALVVGLEVPCGHGNQVDYAPEVVLSAHGHLSSNSRCVKAIAHGLNCMEEVSANTVVLVDECDAGYTVALSLTPYGFGLRLYAGNSIEYGYGTVENAQGALYLSGEVYVAGGVDDLETIFLIVFLPEAGGSCSGNGYAALLLLNHPVHGSCAIMNLTDLVRLARVVQDTLGSGGFTGIDVSHDADVAGMLQRSLSHYSFSYQR